VGTNHISGTVDRLRHDQSSLPVCVINFWWSRVNCYYTHRRPSKRNGLITIWCDMEYLACIEPESRGSVSGSGDSCTTLWWYFLLMPLNFYAETTFTAMIGRGYFGNPVRAHLQLSNDMHLRTVGIQYKRQQCKECTLFCRRPKTSLRKEWEMLWVTQIKPTEWLVNSKIENENQRSLSMDATLWLVVDGRT